MVATNDLVTFKQEMDVLVKRLEVVRDAIQLKIEAQFDKGLENLHAEKHEYMNCFKIDKVTFDFMLTEDERRLELDLEKAKQKAEHGNKTFNEFMKTFNTTLDNRENFYFDIRT